MERGERETGREGEREESPANLHSPLPVHVRLDCLIYHEHLRQETHTCSGFWPTRKSGARFSCSSTVNGQV